VTPINQNLRCNEQIRISPVRVIGENNEQIGVLTSYEALKMAREAGLDLVEVAPNVRPPVCRLMNYGRWKYTQKKNVKKHHEQLLKEVRLRPKTDTNDRKIKMNHAIRFLKQGHKVQFTMVFRGREQSHREIGFATFRAILEEFAQRVKVERPPSMEGRNMVMILSAQKGVFDSVDTSNLPADPDAVDDGRDDEQDELDTKLQGPVVEAEPAQPAAPRSDIPVQPDAV
jgi:translation initiation factor IF-3